MANVGGTSVSSTSPFGPGFNPTKNYSSLFRSGITANVKIERPLVGMPSRGDYGDPGPRPTITGPNRGDYGTASREGLPQFAHDTKLAAREFNDPTKSTNFTNLMRLANEQTGDQVSEVNRHLRDAASRRGYAAGYESDARAASRDRMKAIAESGFAAADRIRDQAASQYANASGAYAKLLGDVNASNTQRDLQFSHDVQSGKEAQLSADVGYGGLINERNIAFANATASAKQKQAELDSAFNNQLIDKARYDQMTNSLAIQLESERNRLLEQRYEFDETTKLKKTQMGREEAELARLRRERGVDPTTGRKYGPAYQGGFAGLR